jgi:PAS domain S-box-containing protein
MNATLTNTNTLDTGDMVLIGLAVTLLLVSLLALILNRKLLKQLKIAKLDKEMSLLRAQDARKFQLAVESTSDLVIIADPEGKVIYSNPAAAKITGYQSYEIIGKKAGTLWGKQMKQEYYSSMWDAIKTQKKVFHGELMNQRKNGEKYIAELTITPILNQNRETNYYLGVERDITQAREVDRMKSEFLSLASHQLRSPLSSIKWSLEVLQENKGENLTDTQVELMETVHKATEQMITLVNTLLNISRIESGRIIIDPKPTDLRVLIQNIIEEVDHRLKLKNQTINIDFQNNIPQIDIDPKLVRHIYVNLITNALKYSPEGKNIDIKVYTEGDNVVSMIKDSGYGIPADEQEKIFKKFFRAKNIVTKDTEGTGLGLYLVKQIVNASQGKIWFESKEDAGTTFWFTMPLAGSSPKQGAVSLAE